MRRLPNRKNNFLGHGATVAFPSSFYDDPKTVRRRHLLTGAEIMISEAQAAFETSRSWGALPGHTLTEVLDTGALFITMKAVYWRPEARARRRAQARQRRVA